jgi:hypothetical protein
MIVQLTGTLLRKIAMPTQLTSLTSILLGQMGDDELGLTYHM